MKYTPEDFHVLEDFTGWQVGHFTSGNSVNHLVARNTETNDLCVLYPYFRNHQTSVVPKYYDANGNRPANRSAAERKKIDEEAARALPSEVKQSLIDHPTYLGIDPQFQELTKLLFGYPVFKAATQPEELPQAQNAHLANEVFNTPVAITSNGETWEITVSFINTPDGDVTCMPKAFRKEPKSENPDQHDFCFLVPEIKEGTINGYKLFGNVILDNMPNAVQTALSDTFCEWAKTLSLPYHKDLPAKIAGTFEETPDQLTVIQKEVKEAGRIALPDNFTMPLFFDVVTVPIIHEKTGRPTQHMWTIDFEFAPSGPSSGTAIKPLITNETTKERYVFDHFEIEAGRHGVTNIVIHQTEPRQDDPISLTDFCAKVPSSVREVIVPNYHELLQKTGTGLSDRVKRVLCAKTPDELLAQDPNWVERLMDELPPAEGYRDRVTPKNNRDTGTGRSPA